jgi:hypothetical protein
MDRIRAGKEKGRNRKENKAEKCKEGKGTWYMCWIEVGQVRRRAVIERRIKQGCAGKERKPGTCAG